TYHINNGGDNLDYSTVRWYDEYAYLAGSTFTANTGYEFVCWNTLANGQGYSHAAGEAFEFPDDAEYGEVITLYAQWRLIDYSITYEMNGGGTNDNRNPATYTYETPEFIIYNAVRNGYDFGGWFDNEELEGDAVTTIALNTTGNVTLYAKWTIIEYTITYNLNGGTNAQSNPGTYTIESERIVFTNPTKDYYDFRGWYTDPEFNPNSEFSTIYENSFGNVTVYAKWQPTAYTITYELNGGTNDLNNPVAYNYESGALQLADATWNQGTFAGWYDNAQFQGDVLEAIPANSHGPLTLYAKWNMTQYSITYELNGGTNSPNNPATYTYTTEDIVFADPVRAGYIFGGWFGDRDFLNGEVEGIPNHSAGNKQVFAKWTLEVYTIAYNLDGGDNPQSNPASYTVETATFELADATKDGYTFVGWYSNPQLTVEADTVIEKGSSGAIVVYAKWAIVNYDITYVLNGGTNNQDNPDSYNIETATITVKSASRTGYTFLGWYDNENFSGIAITSIPQGSTGDITLYAKFKANTYMVYLDKNGAEENGTALGVYDGKNLATMRPPTMTGYHVVGYYTDAEGGTLVADAIGHLQSNVGGLTNAEGAWILNDITTLYTHWAPNEYAVTLDKNGGTEEGSATVTFDAKPLSIATAASRTNYHVTGYYTAETQGIKVAEADGTLIASVDGYTDASGNWIKAEDTTLYAYWAADVYTITYVLNGGTNSQSNPATYTIESDTITLDDADKYGYGFYGWYTNENLTGNSITNILNGSTGDKTLYAKFQPYDYMVYLDKNGAEADGSAAGQYDGKVLIRMLPPTRTGYHIVGYYTEAGESTLVADVDGNLQSNIEGLTNAEGAWIMVGATRLYTHWAPNEYTVTLDCNGGDSDGTATVLYDASSMEITLLPVKTGYRIVGFYPSAQDETSVALADGSLNPGAGNHTNAQGAWMQTSDTTLYARWAAMEYTIPLDKGDGDSDGTATATYDGKPLVINTAPARAGYSVEGYYNGAGDKVANADGTLIADVENYTDGSGNWVYAGAPHLTAHWTVNDYAVTLDKNGGTADGSASVTFDSKPLKQVSAPVRAGYTLSGYYTAATQGTKVAEANGTLIAGITGYTDASGNWIKAEDTTLYAYWTANEYTVTLDKNGGDSAGSATVTFDSKPMTIGTAPARTGYHVDGYYTAAAQGTKVANADGTLIASVSGYTDASGNWIKAEDTTLYAYWAGNTYNLVLDKNRGETDGSATVVYGSRTISISVVPTMTGCQIRGYDAPGNPSYRVADTDGNLIANVEGYTDADGKWIRASDTRIYADWMAVTYTLTIDKSGGDTGGTATVTYGGRTITPVSGPTKTGYEVSSYFIDSENLQRVGYLNGQLLPDVDGYTDGDGKWIRTVPTTLYVSWDAKSYTLTIDKSGGDADGSVTAIFGDGFIVDRHDPTRTGYQAAGPLYLDQACSDDQMIVDERGYLVMSMQGYTSGSGAWIRDGGCTVYTEWAPKSCDILISANGGDADVHFTVSYGSNVLDHPSVPVFAGNDIAGFFTDGQNPVMVIDADCNLIAGVTGYTDGYGNWIYDGGTTLVTHWEHHTYTVTLDKNGGSADGSAKATYGEKPLKQISAPAREGYTLLGYYAAVDGDNKVAGTDGVLIEAIDGYTDGDGNWIRTENNVLYAHWQANTYHVTLDAGSGTVTPTSKDIVFGSEYELPVPEYAAHYFSSWMNGQTPVATTGVWSIASDVTLTADWSDQPIWQISFVGGDGSAGSTAPVSVLDGETLTFPANGFTKEGYSFAGWSDGQNTYQPNATKANITAAAEYTAVWNANVHKVTYKLDGAVLDGDYAPKDTAYATSVTVLGTYQKKGYTITPWSTEDVIVADGSFTMPDKDVVFNATSTPINYDVPLYMGDIGFNDGAANVDYGATSLTIVTEPARAGYHPAGYATYFSKIKVAEADGTLLPSIDDSGDYTDSQGRWIRTMEFVNMALYTIWEPDVYDVALDKNGGSTDGAATVTYDAKTLNITTVPVRAGYSVEGYYADEGLTVKVARADGHLCESIDGYTNMEDQWQRTRGGTLYVKWEPNVYTVTLDKNGGTADGTANATFEGKPMAVVTAPVKANYHVSGYYTAAAQGTKVAEEDGTLIASVDGFTDASGNWIKADFVTLYAEWAPDTYTVTLDKNGGTADGSATATYDGKPMAINAAATKTGYGVVGYFTAATQGIQVAEADGTLIASVDGYTDASGNWIRTSDATLFAQWNANTYKVTLDAGQGSVDPTTMDIVYGNDYALPVPSWAGHYFSAWKDGQTSVATSGKWSIASDVTLTAEWTEQPVYQITFLGGDGATGSVTPIEVLQGGTLTFPANGFAKAGHTFAGWSDGTSTYRPQATKENITAAARYTALWTVNTHTVTYKLDGEVLDGDYAPKTVA
ncbi:MAG: InlB B-repeat-containing protein, partial [Candidatus Methanomethylophilaceae archaeon]|nr:InlB B-repeat-containing protein [Candidatus Methanomethylophilaceae archaeon]